MTGQSNLMVEICLDNPVKCERNSYKDTFLIVRYGRMTYARWNRRQRALIVERHDRGQEYSLADFLWVPLHGVRNGGAPQAMSHQHHLHASAHAPTLRDLLTYEGNT